MKLLQLSIVAAIIATTVFPAFGMNPFFKKLQTRGYRIHTNKFRVPRKPKKENNAKQNTQKKESFTMPKMLKSEKRSKKRSIIFAFSTIGAIFAGLCYKNYYQKPNSRKRK